MWDAGWDVDGLRGGLGWAVGWVGWAVGGGWAAGWVGVWGAMVEVIGGW